MGLDPSEACTECSCLLPTSGCDASSIANLHMILGQYLTKFNYPGISGRSGSNLIPKGGGGGFHYNSTLKSSSPWVMRWGGTHLSNTAPPDACHTKGGRIEQQVPSPPKLSVDVHNSSVALSNHPSHQTKLASQGWGLAPVHTVRSLKCLGLLPAPLVHMAKCLAGPQKRSTTDSGLWASPTTARCVCTQP